MFGSPEGQRRSRRGANAIEFALVSPLLIAMLAGIVDYGWYFWREALIINGLRESVRSGGLQMPLVNESGGTCSKCLAAATAAATTELTKQGYPGVSVKPKIERLPASGTPCTYAVVIDMAIPHQRIFDLVPSPEKFDVRVVSMAQNMVCE